MELKLRTSEAFENSKQSTNSKRARELKSHGNKSMYLPRGLSSYLSQYPNLLPCVNLARVQRSPFNTAAIGETLLAPPPIRGMSLDVLPL